ncbi:FRP1 like protein with a FAT domain and a phosphatidylinositol kinase domain [Cryptosporidium ryanae]|uniref:FRP1 like protein with a FAT domain and a phosphatidylinositol kinase domain n=1 Tax=Cryptosporidium ryanae TaxID=515981 RepID=UPI00351A1E4A|nr:FRP1 like protein with a FAT domain and a phosphatidylinositol kinase domain [Cryptosporidium ryanae]
MEKTELFSIIDTLKDVEETQRTLDEFVDSHSDCIGTIRRYLLEGIREYVFGRDDTEECLNTLKSINSSLKGLCCSFGNISFPLSGLGQLFYRILIKVFTIELPLKFNVESTKDEIETFKIKKNRHIEVVEHCIDLLSTILKLLFSENNLLVYEFIDETLKSICYLNRITKKGELGVKNDALIHDIYKAFIDKLAYSYNWSNGNEAPVTLKFPNSYFWSQFILGKMTVNLLKIHVPCFQYSLTRDRFIYAWLNIFISAIIKNKKDLFGIHLSVLKTLTNNFNLKIDNSSFYLVYKKNAIEILYENGITTNSNSYFFDFFLDEYSTIRLIGDFTIWYFDGFQKKYVSNNGLDCEINKTSYCYQLERAFNVWFETLSFFSHDTVAEYCVFIIYTILNRIPLFTQQMITKIENKVQSELFNMNHTIMKTDFCSLMKPKLLIFILKLVDIQSLILKAELTKPGILNSEIDDPIYGIFELCSTEIGETNYSLFIAHIQILISRYVTTENLHLENISTLTFYAVSTAFILVEDLIKLNLGCNFEFGSYLLNHFCRIIDSIENGITKWGINQCIFLSELALRILAKCKDPVDNLIFSLLNLLGHIENASISIIWNCITNLLLINCINSNNFDKLLIERILQEVISLDFNSSSYILLKVIKPLSIIIFKNIDQEICSSIINEADFLIESIETYKESFFPFGSSFDSLSNYCSNKFTSKCKSKKKIGFLPCIICANCNKNITSVPAHGLFTCNDCFSIISTSIDIDNSVFIPEIKYYLSTIDISFGYKSEKYIDQSLVKGLINKLNDISKNITNDRCDFFLLISINLKLMQNKLDNMTPNFFEFMQFGMFGNRKYVTYSHIKSLALLLSKEFIFIGYNSPLENMKINLIRTELLMPPPIGIEKITKEITDPIANILSKYGNLFRLSLLLSYNINKNTNNSSKNNILSHIFLGNSNEFEELISSEFEVKIIDDLINFQKNLKNSFSFIFDISRSIIQKMYENPGLKDFVNINIDIWNIMFLSANLDEKLFSRFLSVIVDILDKSSKGIKTNWKRLWSKEDLTEFLKGIIPGGRCNSINSFKGNSCIIYKLITILSSLLMKHNTTLSSISISPGLKKFISIKCFYHLDLQPHHQPNNVIILFGPSFNYVFPNMFYRSLVEFSSNTDILNYTRRFMPNTLSHDKLVTLLPYYFLSVLENSELRDNKVNSKKDLILYFNEMKKNFYLRLLQIDTENDLGLPKTLINTSIAALLWLETNIEDYIYFGFNKFDENINISIFPGLNVDEISLNVNDNTVFINQYICLSNKIRVLLFESGIIEDEVHSKNKKVRISLDESSYGYNSNDNFVEDYIGKNLMWFLEFYSKTIFLDKASNNMIGVQHTFFPVSFIINKKPPKANYCSIYWHRIFRTTSLLLFFSKKYVKKYATRLIELLIKLTHTSVMHPSSIESWEIYINCLFNYTNRNIDPEKDIFLQLFPPIIDQIYLMVETHKSSIFRIYFEELFEKILFKALKINSLFFSLIPVVPNAVGIFLKKVIVRNFHISQGIVQEYELYNFDKEYDKLIITTFRKRIDLTLQFLSPNVPHITYEKLLGSIKDILTMFPTISYWLLYDKNEMDKDILSRIFQLFEKSTNIISNAGNDSLLAFQKQNISDNFEGLDYHLNDEIISRYNLIKHSFKNNNILSDLTINRKINYSIEKSISFLKNIIAGIIGSIGAFDVNILNYLQKMSVSMNERSTVRNFFDDSFIFPSIKKSIFLKKLDTIVIELIENHLITYSHWNVAAYAIQETLKYIGCHNSMNTENKFKNWDKFKPEIREILHPYLSTEYRIIQGTKDHLLDQIKKIDKNTENVYEFYFWCLDQINEELLNIKERSNYQVKIPNSILNINILLEGCRLVSLGVPYVFNIILLISIECMILFFDHSKIRILKGKLCSLVISGIKNNEINMNNKNELQSSNSIPFQDITYESIFIVMTHLIELYEYLIQCKVPKTLTWFNESLLEPFLLELYSSESIQLDKSNDEINKNSDSSSYIGIISPSSTTLSLLAEATKIDSSRKMSSEKNNDFGFQSDNEFERYIYNQKIEKNLCKNIINEENQRHANFNPGMRLFSTLTNYPILKIVANLQFITDIPISILIQAALSCRTYTRALLLFERFLLTKQLNSDYSKKKRKINKKSLSFTSQFGLKINYSGNVIDYLGTNGFTNIHFDPLNPLNFYKASSNTYIDLSYVPEHEKKKLNTHILYLPFQCYLGINDIENLLGTMSIYEQMSAASEGVIGKQLIESFLREDYFKAAMIYENILLNIPTKNTIITKCYFRCLIKAGLPKIVLNTLLQSRNTKTLDSEIIESKKDNIISNYSLFISEALEACYSLGSWEYLDTFLSDFNNENYCHMKNYLSENSYLNFFIPSNIDVVAQKFDIYYGKLLLHLYFLRNNKNDALQKNRLCESFRSSLERTRNLLFTQNNIFWKDSNFVSSKILENLHILMDVEYTYNFISAESDNQFLIEYISNNIVSSVKPLWLSMSELFVNRVDNAQSNYSVKHSILSHAKLGLEISGFDLASLSILLVLEKSKMHFLHKSVSYVNFLDSFEIIENVPGLNNQNITHLNNRVPSIIGLSDFNLNNLFLLSFGENVPGIIQINKSITIDYFEHILGIRTNIIKSWTELERKLLDEWEQTNGNIYITCLNRSLIVTYLFKLFQTNQVRKATYLYELISNTQILIDNNTLSEINLVYLDWAIKSSTVSPENIIKIFQKTIEYRSNCEKTYFQFANYLDSYFHLIISNIESENNIKTNVNSTIGNSLGSLINCDEIIILCIIMYLNSLKCGNMFIYPSLSRVLFLIFNHSNILLKLGALNPQKNQGILLDENMSSFPDSLGKIRKELFTLSPSLWYIVLPQLLSRSQHPGLGSFVIQPLVARIIRALPRQAGWFFVSMLKSNCNDRKNTAFEILKISKTFCRTNETFPIIDENDCSLIIDEYTRLFDNLSVLAMDTSAGTNLSLLSRGEKSNKNSNKSMSLRSDFQTLYHSMKNMNKSKYMIIPTQKQLRSYFLPINQTKNVLFSQFLSFMEGQNNKIFLSSQATSNLNDEFSEMVSICGIEDNIIILPSKQKPKKIGLIGSDGEIYYYLVKNEKRGDLRKDMRLMELAQLINERMSINFKDLSLRTFSVIPLSEVTGIIEWVPNVTTLGSIVMNEWKEILGNSRFHRQLMETQDILRQNSMYPEKLYKIYCEEVLPKYPPILHNWFFKKFSTKSSYNWLTAKQKYTKSTATWSMFGYIVGLGDRHAENILIDTSSGDIVHVDFDCLFGKGFLLEIPEIVPFRLTPNIVIAMGSCGVEGTFTGACISAMNIFRSPFNKSFIMTFLEAFIHDPLIEWMRPGKASQIANVCGGVDPVSFIAAAKGHSHLRTIQRKLSGMVDCTSQTGKKIGEICKINGSQRRTLHERGLGLSVESQVNELINSAKCKRNLSQMYVGWMPQL